MFMALFVLAAAGGKVAADSSTVAGTPPPGGTRQDGAPMRVLLDREAGRFVGFAILSGSNTLRVDMKFWAQNGVRCANSFDAANEGNGWGWYRMCTDAARFGPLRLAGSLVADPGSRSYAGTLSATDRGFVVDAIFGVLDGCVKEIGVRGAETDYTFFAVDCTEAGGDPDMANGGHQPFWPGGGAGGPTDKDVSDALNDAFFGSVGNRDGAASANSQDQTGGRNAGSVGVPLAPGTASSRENTLAPSKGADADLFPNPGFGYVMDLLPEDAPPLAVVRLERLTPGKERIVFESFEACHAILEEVSREFCTMAKSLAGQSLPIADYGFNGRYGVGRFEHDGYIWFVRLRVLPDQRIEAEFIRTLLHVDSELGPNPGLRDAPPETDLDGRRVPVATEDLYPLEGYGHLLAFIENRMPMSPARKNLLVQSGDVVFRSDQRIHVDDYGQCPPQADPRFCRETEQSIYKSWPLESYLFNGVIGTAEVTYGGARYIVVLSKSDRGRIRSQFFLADNEIAARFATPLGPRKKDADAPAGDLACVSEFRGEPKIFENVTNHRNVPVSWCASNGSCADGKDPLYLQALCELALREEQRISAKWAYLDGAEAIWGQACAVPGAEQDAVSMTPYDSDRFDISSVSFGITDAYIRNAESGRPIDQNPGPKYAACSNCQTVAKLACEFFAP